MTFRPHFAHPLQDSQGDLIFDASIRVLDPNTMDPIPETLYGDSDLTAPLDQPLFSSNGQVEFYLEKPRIVTIEVTAFGSTYLFENRPVGFPQMETHAFTLAGEAGVSVGTLRYYVEEDSFIETVRISVGQPPTGSSMIVDINLNGTTIFSDPDARPTLAEGEYTAMATPDITTVPSGSYFTLDVDQVGSTFAGAQLVVQIRTRRA